MYKHLPKYHEIMQPVLEIMSDGKLYSLKILRPKVAKVMKLSEEDINLTYPKTGAFVFYDRLSWAMTFLRKAEYIERAEAKFNYKITEDGLNALKDAKENNKAVDYVYLKENIANFDARFSVSKNTKEDSKSNKDNEDSQSTRDLEQELEDDKENFNVDFLNYLNNIPWQDFEELCIDLLTKMGYGVRKPGTKDKAKVGDGGIDGELFEDELGLNGSIYIQAKRWKDNIVHPKDIKEFLYNTTSNKGVFITTSSFSKEAEREVENNKSCRVALINGKRLIELCKKYEIGCKKQIIERYNLDDDYFKKFG